MPRLPGTGGSSGPESSSQRLASGDRIGARLRSRPRFHMKLLESRVSGWEGRPPEPPEGAREAALRLLDAAEAARRRGTVPALLWHRFLDATRRPRFLQALGAREARDRWADVAVAAIQASRYTLATMLAQRVSEHPAGRSSSSRPSPGRAAWSYEATARRLRRTAAVFLRAQRKAAGGDPHRERPRRRLRRPRLPRARHPRHAAQPRHRPRVARLRPRADCASTWSWSATSELRARAERARPRRALPRLRARSGGAAARRGAGAPRRGGRGLAPAQVQRALEDRRAPPPRRARDRDVHLRQHAACPRASSTPASRSSRSASRAPRRCRRWARTRCCCATCRSSTPSAATSR